jgi:parvulin-like peptidyl-prolyl cis-trans isomerase-like protein
LTRLLREPLLHFAVLGAALFGVYRVVAPRGSDTSAIAISSDQIVSMAEQFRSVWQRPPTREELEQLIAARVRDEVLYREGLALGLERDDPVVRNRVRQKVEALAEDASTAVPTDAELQAYLDAHRQQFVRPAVLSFEQVYFDPARREATLESDVGRAREALRSGRSAAGDPTLLPPQMERALPADIQAVFGAEFEAAARSLPAGPWSEPIRSSFGLHLVRVTARTESSAPVLGEARDAVLREWSRARSVEARERFYASLRERYSIEIAPIPKTAPLTARSEESK